MLERGKLNWPHVLQCQLFFICTIFCSLSLMRDFSVQLGLLDFISVLDNNELYTTTELHSTMNSTMKMHSYKRSTQANMTQQVKCCVFQLFLWHIGRMKYTNHCFCWTHSAFYQCSAQRHTHIGKFIVSQSIKASRGSIMTHCSEIEGHWWPGLIVSEPCLLGWTESLLIYIGLIPATTFVLTLVTKERSTRWFFPQRLIHLIRPR